MNALQTELERLYPTPDSANGEVRRVVLELARPASWDDLAKVWQGVQADLGLPAPGIAVSGTDAYQLWFSLARPVPFSQATAFVAGLRKQYLDDIDAGRVSMPSPASTPPPFEKAPGRWAAFVAPDLASLFVDEPWIDHPPGVDAQAALLSRLQVIKAEAWAHALARLQPAATTASATTASNSPGAPAVRTLDARQFLLDVMNDPAVDLRLHIEAAKALLPRAGG